jgi:dimeric dUTPase (all-alpha-NTP-PPase superfamily)
MVIFCLVYLYSFALKQSYWKFQLTNPKFQTNLNDQIQNNFSSLENRK